MWDRVLKKLHSCYISYRLWSFYWPLILINILNRLRGLEVFLDNINDSICHNLENATKVSLLNSITLGLLSSMAVGLFSLSMNQLQCKELNKDRDRHGVKETLVYLTHWQENVHFLCINPTHDYLSMILNFKFRFLVRV